MDNAIPTRVFNFLKQYPPFSLLNDEDLMKVAEYTIVQYFNPKEKVFTQGEKPEAMIHILRQGAIHLFFEENGQHSLIDQYDEGDVFGLRGLIGQGAHQFTAEAIEESLVYSINLKQVKSLFTENSQIAWYLTQSFAGTPTSKHLSGSEHPSEQLVDKLGEIQRISPKKTPVVCTANTSIKEAAQMMHRENVGSIIIIDHQQYPIGIITDRDLRNKVVAATLDLDTKVEVIMSSPVITAPPDCTVADVQMIMMRHRIHHLCITASGKPDSQIQGIISEHDLLVVQANNPAVLIREIQRAQDTETLRMIREKAEVLLHKYLLQEVAINFISKMMTEINDALIQKAIILAEEQVQQEGLEKPDTKWCWLALGSEGRCEQLLRTDQDNALLYEDVPEAEHETVQFYFQALAGKITQLLNECGFDYCPGDMMASNPKWCKTLSQWKNQFYKWIVEPTAQNIMYCNIFFDFRGIYGQVELADQLSQFIIDCIEEKAMFLPFLASDAIRIPPLLTFFRNFVVEKSGEHKDQFDIKGRAMMPLADAARVLILEAKQVKITNTIQRFRKMAEIDPVNQELFIQAAEAYEILMRFRALQGLKNKNSGRYFKPTELSKMQRLSLRNSFKPIQELQGILKIRFRLNLMI